MYAAARLPPFNRARSIDHGHGYMLDQQKVKRNCNVKNPNVLILMCDQMQAKRMGFVV